MSVVLTTSVFLFSRQQYGLRRHDRRQRARMGSDDDDNVASRSNVRHHDRRPQSGIESDEDEDDVARFDVRHHDYRRPQSKMGSNDDDDEVVKNYVCHHDRDHCYDDEDDSDDVVVSTSHFVAFFVCLTCYPHYSHQMFLIPS